MVPPTLTPKRRYPGKRSDNTVNEANGTVDTSKLPEAVLGRKKN